MKTTNTKQTEKTGGAKPQSTNASKLFELFEDELKDIYWAEKALTKALPKMIKNADNDELIEALENHLNETEGHVDKVEKVFGVIGKNAAAKKCEAMEGLIKEAEELMEEHEKGAIRDAAIISAAQKVEHYEIASYGTLRTFAQTLGIDAAISILEEILEQEKAADEKLTEVAETAVNMDALADGSGDEEEQDEEEMEEDEHQ